MNARIAKLEALLVRVHERAEKPRTLETAAGASEEAATAEVDDLEDEPAPFAEIDDFDDVKDLPEVELDEPDMPISGPVSQREPTMDDAIDEAAYQPPVTPPPESGEELTRPQIPLSRGPTIEQLGETIALEEGGPQTFELDEPTLDEPRLSEPPPSYKQAEIPASLPPAHEDLTLPENAREELERVRLGESTPLQARVSSRPVLSTNVVDLVSSARDFAPKSFLDLLEASLKLK